MMSDKSTCACGETASEDQVLEKLDEVIKEYKDKPGALIPLLQIAQAALRKISLALNKSYSEVAGVVGFYAFFSTKPRGKHLIRVCLGTACYVRGGKRVLDAIKKNLNIDVGQMTPDKMFSLEVARCFGACGLAPTMCIDNDVHKRIRPAKVGDIINSYSDRQTATR
jgi:NADH:ubiquinone oxidoreductase subunit E